MNPQSIDEWFPVAQQRKYVSLLREQVCIGLTRRRAEYFVRLWAYLWLKQCEQMGDRIQKPLTELDVPDNFVSCTHREANDLFYGQSDRGSDRAAGMMIDTFVDLGLIDKQFDGNTICIRIRPLWQQIKDSPKPKEIVQLEMDTFDPRSDAIPLAMFLAANYNWMKKKTAAAEQKIASVLREWAKQYLHSMRVLRRCDTHNPVGFYTLYATAKESEKYFFMPPRKVLYLTTNRETDPMKMAVPGDPYCTSILVRSWAVDPEYKKRAILVCLIEDMQKTLIRMKADFPNLCDMYLLMLHPEHEAIGSVLGFQKTTQDTQLPVYWMYKGIDQFLSLDITKILSNLDFPADSGAL